MEVGLDLTESFSSDTDLGDLHGRPAVAARSGRCRLVRALVGRCLATVP